MKAVGLAAFVLLAFATSANAVAVMSIDIGSEWMKIAVVSVRNHSHPLRLQRKIYAQNIIYRLFYQLFLTSILLLGMSFFANLFCFDTKKSWKMLQRHHKTFSNQKSWESATLPHNIFKET